VSVATQTAPIIQLFTVSFVFAKEQTTPAVTEQWLGARELLGAANCFWSPTKSGFCVDQEG
jgi:hypothetical protein